MDRLYTQRWEQLRRKRTELELDSLLITNPINVSYLTGFSGDSSYLWLSRKEAILISDTRYEIQIAEECPGLNVEIRDSRSTTNQMAVQVLQSAGCKSVGIEGDTLTKAAFDELCELAGQQCPVVSTRGLVESLRMIKHPSEIQTIRRSIAINQRCFEIVRSQLRPDQTERSIAFQLEHQMRQLGADQCAFKPIVGVGDRSALPHGVPGSRTVGESPFLLVDWGAQVEGYCSDLTRMILLGKPPAKLLKIYQIVLDAQQAAIAAIRPGAAFQEVDRAARSVIERAGFGKYFGHGLGHGFGRQIHELPFLNPIRQGKLEPNMVITVEPGIYLPELGGVRIEDDCLVTADGVEVLCSLPKDIDSAFHTIL